MGGYKIDDERFRRKESKQGRDNCDHKAQMEKFKSQRDARNGEKVNSHQAGMN